MTPSHPSGEGLEARLETFLKMPILRDLAAAVRREALDEACAAVRANRSGVKSDIEAAIRRLAGGQGR
jgi:hypothetical protein